MGLKMRPVSRGHSVWVRREVTRTFRDSMDEAERKCRRADRAMIYGLAGLLGAQALITGLLVWLWLA